MKSNSLGPSDDQIEYYYNNVNVDAELNAKYESAISDLGKLFAKQDGKMKRKRDRLVDLQQRYKHLLKQMDELRNARANHSSPLHKITKEMSAQNAQFHILRTILNEKDKLIKMFQLEADREDKINSHSQINELKSQNGYSKNAENDEIYRKYEMLKKSNDKLQAAYDSIVKDTNARTFIVDSDLETQKHGRESSNKCKSLMHTIKELNDNNERLRQNESNLKIENQNLKNRLINYNRTVGELQLEFVRFQNKMKEFEHLKHDHQELRSSYEQIVNDKAMIETELNTKQMKMKVMEIKNRELSREKMRLSAKIDSVKHGLKIESEQNKQVLRLLKRKDAEMKRNVPKKHEVMMRNTQAKPDVLDAPIQARESEYFANDNTKALFKSVKEESASKQESMAAQEGVALLSIYVACKECKSYIDSLMLSLLEITEFVGRVWDKETSINKEGTRGIVKLILQYEGSDIMDNKDVQECIDVLKGEENVIDIEIRKYEYLDDSDWSNLGDQNEAITVNERQYRLSKSVRACGCR